MPMDRQYGEACHDNPQCISDQWKLPVWRASPSILPPAEWVSIRMKVYPSLMGISGSKQPDMQDVIM